MRAPCPTHTNFETPGRGASNEVTYAISNQRLVSFFASLDSIAHSGSIGSRARARSILRNLGLAREGFMACWWASGAPTRSELCPPVGLTCPGRAQPSPPLTPAFARPRPMRQQPPQPTPRHARRPQPSDLVGRCIDRCPHLPPTHGGNQRPLGARGLCLQSYSLLWALVVAA